MEYITLIPEDKKDLLCIKCDSNVKEELLSFIKSKPAIAAIKERANELNLNNQLGFIKDWLERFDDNSNIYVRVFSRNDAD
jgi:hypothetical protein